MKLKVYKTTLLLCIFVILLSFVMKLFGYTGFSIPIIDHAINNNLTLAIISYGLTYSFNVILILTIIVKQHLKYKEVLIIIVIAILVYFINGILNLGYFSFILELALFIIIPQIICKDKKLIPESIVVSILNIVYQSISMFTKGLNVSITTESFTTNLIFLIDYYMLLLITLLYTMWKGENCYEIFIKFIRRWWMETISIFHSKRRCEEKCIQQNQTSNQEVEVGYLVFNIVLAIFQITLVGFVSFLVKNTIVNFVIIYLSFIILRSVFKESYHAETVLKCTTMAMVIFTCATELSLDVNISILSSVLVGLLVAFILHIAYYYENYIKCTNDITKLDLENLKLRLGYLEQIEIEMLYDYWHRGNTTVDEVAEKYGYNKMKIYRTLNKIKQD